MKIAIITANYPYLPGEEFFESEIRFWENSNFEKIYILPASSNGKPRFTPKNIEIDLSLSDKNFPKIFYAGCALFSKHFYIELTSLWKLNKFTYKTILMLFIASAKYFQARHKLFKWLKNKDSVD